MNNSKGYLQKLRTYLSTFKKTDKKDKPPKLKIANKKTVNIAVIGGICFLLLVGLMGSIRAITLSNQVTVLQNNLENLKNNSNQTQPESEQFDYRLQYYLNDFVHAYFTLPQDINKQQEQIKHLNNFYDFTPDIKSQGQVRNTSELVSAQLLTIQDNVASYKVKYKEKIGKDKNNETKEYLIGFNIPFGKRGEQYFISGLPWFTSLKTYQAKQFDENEKLQLSANDRLTEQEHKEIEKFLTVFFTNYTSNQDNLNLISKNITVVSNTKFKSLDYTYIKKEGETTLAFVQATFEIGGTSHSENFTFTLTQTDKNYFVSKLEHTIPLNYANNKE